MKINKDSIKTNSWHNVDWQLFTLMLDEKLTLLDRNFQEITEKQIYINISSCILQLIEITDIYFVNNTAANFPDCPSQTVLPDNFRQFHSLLWT